MTERPRPGDRLGHYRLERALGAGGMGAVFAAHDELLDRRVAVKLLHAGSAETLLVEARALAALDHPNIVRVYGLQRVGGRELVAMQLVDGQSFDDVLAVRRSLPPPEAASVVRSVADALTAMHHIQRIHGDVKPSNILRENGTGRVLLGDFGLSRPIDDPGPVGLARGTPGYMAPEQARGLRIARELRSRADVYSLAVTAFELLTGKLPFDHPDPRELLRRQWLEDPPRPSAVLGSLGWRLDRAILAALAKSPEQRTAKCDAFAADLERAVRAGSAPPRILLADDDADHRRMLALGLTKRLGRIVIEAVPDGERAYRAASERAPDLAVLDLDMPGLNGLELAMSIRAMPELARMPIIVVSGNAQPRERELLERVGVDRCYDKPVPLWKLADAVRALLGTGAERASGRFDRVGARSERPRKLGETG